nr:hypothetical protein [Tanacetum cinerariifolium]
IVQLILFIVDSGCTKHMTGNLKLLCNFVKKFLGTVRFGNDQFAPILGYGDLAQGNVTINRVYYVEGLNHNLFSVGRFCDADLEDQLCSSCELSKAKRSSFKSKAVPTSKGRLNLLHMDLCGPMRVASMNGKKYIMVIVDDYSRYTWTVFLRSKDETPEVLKDFLMMIQRNLQAPMITVRTDRGTEFLNKSLNAFFKEEGIEHQTSTARTPEQNGVVEIRNRTLVEAARTMLSASQLPLFLWAEAITTACYTQNRSIVILTPDKTPYHIINDRKSSIKHLHIFGGICYITRYGKNLDKMKEKGDQCILVRYSTQLKGYHVYNKRTRMIVESIHIRFDEIKEVSETSVANNTSGLVPQRQKASDYDNPDPVPQREDVSSSADADVPSQQELDLLFEEEEQLQDDEFTNPFGAPAQEQAESSSHNIGNSNVPTFNQPQVFEYRWTKDHPLEQVHGNPSRPVQTRRQLATDPEICMYALTVSTAEPKNIKEAMADLAFIEAMLDELHQFDRLHIHQSPSGIFINQAKYNLEILHKHGMDKGKIIGTPMATKPKLDADLSGNPVDQTDYRSKIGSLMYLASSRPDKVQAVAFCPGLRFVLDCVLSWTAFCQALRFAYLKTICYVLLRTNSAKLKTALRFVLGVNHKPNVSRPQLKSDQSRDKVLPNNSQVKVKKTQVEVHPRIPSVSNKMMSVIACKDSLNSGTLNANAVCATCNKCLVDSNHFACVTKMLNDVHARTKKPNVVPVSTRKPKIQANKSMATPNKKKFAPIIGYGDLAQGNVTINRVYYVEGLNHNLFSVGQFCDPDLEVAFRKPTCFVRDLRGNDLLIGNRGSDLYTISLQESTSSTPLCLMAKAIPTQAWLWHRRLSYLNFDYINLLSKKDIVASMNGKKYILVIVDDYSSYTWTLFLRSKDETPEVMKYFLTTIQRNLQALVITIRTDRGTDFLNKSLNAFFKEEGIEHQTSTARTPKQNGVVEIQNRTLVEAARMMLSALQLPLLFWAEAIATACYTQN